MKFTKYLAIILGIIAILLAGGWFLRNTIIQRISNPLLAQYGLTVTDVSLDALATQDATISHLEFEHASGVLVIIEDLTLPIRNSPDGFRIYAAERIVIELAEADSGESPAAAEVVRQLLALPALLPRIEVRVATIEVQPYPGIRDLSWQLAGDQQHLSMFVDGIALQIDVAQTDGANHVLRVSIAEEAAATNGQTITTDIRPTADGIAVHGSATLDLVRWMPLAARLGIGNVDVQSGTASLTFDAELPDSPDGVIALLAGVTPTSPVQMAVFDASGDSTLISLESAESFEIEASFPDLQWVIRQAEATLLLSRRGLPDIQVSLVNQSCRNGLTCAGGIGVIAEELILPFAEVDRLTLIASEDVTLADGGLTVRFRPDASLNLVGVSRAGLSVGNIDAKLASLATAELHDDGWRFGAESIELGIGSLTVGDNIDYTATWFLNKIEISNPQQEMIATLGLYTTSGKLNWLDQQIHLPGFSGGISRQGAEVAVILQTDGLHQEGSIEMSHNLEQNSGRLGISDTVLSFDAQGMAGLISPWTNIWDFSAGTIAFELQSEWQESGDDWRVTAQSSVQVNELSGAFADNAFIGLTSSLNASYDSSTEVAIAPSSLKVDLLDVGIPILNLSADYLLAADGSSIDVDNLHMQVFGGEIAADPFSFRTASEINTVYLHATSIDLSTVLSMQDFESVEISGHVGADLPVIIAKDSISVAGGTLHGEAPGGVIRYLPGIAANGTDVSGLGIVTRALSNFEYDSLTSEVEYSPDGDLKLKMRISGRNPDLEDNRPVILNLGVENNVPKMLRSLRAARTVEDILERRLTQ